MLPLTDALPTACICWSLEYTPLGTLLDVVLKDAEAPAEAPAEAAKPSGGSSRDASDEQPS